MPDEKSGETNQSDRKPDESKPGQQPPPGTQPVNTQPSVPPIAISTSKLAVEKTDAENPGIHALVGDKQLTDANEDARPTKTERSMIRLTSVITWSTVIIMVATVANVGVFYYEAEDGGRQTEKLANKAGEIVGAMNTALTNSRTDIGNAFAANKSAVDASTTQSKKSLDASIQTFRRDQRAWIIASEPGRFDMFDGKNIIVPVQIRNTGKTPALHVSANLSALIFQRGEVPSFQYVFPHHFYALQKGTVFPGDADSHPIDIPVAERAGVGYSRLILTAPMHDQLNRAEAFVFIYGQIDYTDIFGVRHWTRFCGYGPGTQDSTECPQYNAIDSND